jgi:Fur family iron response transcriptional regulator
MNQATHISDLSARMRAAGLRPTRQRRELAGLLYSAGDRHVTAEVLHREAGQAGVRVSLATVYNTLHQFTSVGLLREVVVDMGQSYFDTNTTHHHHFFDEKTGQLTDREACASPPCSRMASVNVVARPSCR